MGGGSKCTVCDQVFKRSQGNTSNLIKHILSVHKDTKITKELKVAIKKKKLVDRMKAKKKNDSRKLTSSLLPFINRQSKISSQKKEAMDKAIIHHIVLSNNPFSEVEEQSFRNVLFKAEPNYVAPSRTTVANWIEKTYINTKKLLRKEIVEHIGKTEH